MTAAKAMEYRITQALLRRRADDSKPAVKPRLSIGEEVDQSAERFSPSMAERVIAIAAVTAGLLVLGALLQELLWVAIGGATIVALSDEIF